MVALPKYEKELESISVMLVKMCRLAENIIDLSVSCLATYDAKSVTEVYETDKEIDKMERDIENACIKTLLMEHPVAGDFREVSAALKMITDLERIGDQARDIAELSVQLVDGAETADTLIPEMAKRASAMVKAGVDSYINRDVALAESLDKADDIVDLCFEKTKKDFISFIKKSTQNIDEGVALLLAAKYLERIADHAVNIGEWVVYAVTGRHPLGIEGKKEKK